MQTLNLFFCFNFSLIMFLILFKILANIVQCSLKKQCFLIIIWPCFWKSDLIINISYEWMKINESKMLYCVMKITETFKSWSNLLTLCNRFCRVSYYPYCNTIVQFLPMQSHMMYTWDSYYASNDPKPLTAIFPKSASRNPRTAEY